MQALPSRALTLQPIVVSQAFDSHGWPWWLVVSDIALPSRMIIRTPKTTDAYQLGTHTKYGGAHPNFIFSVKSNEA